jgi:hypothetical protein
LRTTLPLLCLYAATLAAQDFPKNEFQTLYLHGQLDGLLTQQDPALIGKFKARRPHHGFAFAYVRNTSPISGLKFEVSWMRDENTVRFGPSQTPFFDRAATTFTYRQSPLWILVGPQFKRNRTDATIKPFFHMLGGPALYRTSLPSGGAADCATALGVPTCPTRFNSDRWTFSAVIGGGIDIRLTDHVDLRLAQIDYSPISRFGKTAHNVRFGVGFIFH